MKIFDIIYSIFGIIVALVVILLAFSFFPIAGNYKIYVVQSGSMEPAIHTGSVVFVKPLKNYEIGDIITFKAKNSDKDSVTHRVVNIEIAGGAKNFITKGDANNAEDANKAEENQIIGKVLFSMPYAGYAVATAKKPVGFMLLIIVPAGIIIFEEIGNIRRELEKRKQNKVGN